VKGSESGVALKELQSTIQGCLVAFRHSSISTESRDCVLVFLCSSKLPKLTLSLWEQSLFDKSEIPKWEETNKLLSKRYRTLEAIEDIKPSTSTYFKSTPTARNLHAFDTKVNAKHKKLQLLLQIESPNLLVLALPATKNERES